MKFIFLVPLLLLSAGNGLAADDMRPANFDYKDVDKQLGSRIKFPEVKGDMSTMILCFSQIATSGKMTNTGCYAKDNFDGPFAQSIMKAAKRSRMNPAIINGQERKIYLQFRVEFFAQGEDRDIYFYSNPAYAENLEAYGKDHVAAQRAIGKENWQGVCPQHAKYLVAVRAFIGEDGRAQSPSIERISGIMPTADCQNAIKETILQSSYTPAMADGYPVPSAFFETFSN